MKIRDIVRLPEERGFVLDRRKGSHRQYEGFVNDKRRIVTVAGKDSDEILPGALASIKRQSGLPGKLFN